MTNEIGDLRDVVLLYDRLALTGDAAAQDVEVQLRAVDQVLRGFGISTTRLPVDLNLGSFRKRMLGLHPDLAFNLVESLECSDRLQSVVPLLLEEWGVPFTGSGSLSMILANNKPATKQRLLDQGLPTPAAGWLAPGGVLCHVPGDDAWRDGISTWIVKTRESHASLFLDDSSIITAEGGADLAGHIARAEDRYGQPFFAEQFVSGREFNLSIIEDRQGTPVVLPPAEITFAALPDGAPHIVGYAAKWDEASPEFTNTPRVFPGAGEQPLLDQLSTLALAAWNALGLAGYARIDFRVDEAGNPFILEANANPCLSPDAGLAAAAAKGGLSYDDLVRRIVMAALRHTR